jgi:beta-glucosidase
LAFDRHTVRPSDDLTATVDASNTGTVASDEVVQLYVSHPGVNGAPLRALAAMQRVRLLPGETKTVALRVSNRDLSMVGSDGIRRIIPGELNVWVGDGQPGSRKGLARAAGIFGSVTIEGEATLPR